MSIGNAAAVAERRDDDLVLTLTPELSVELGVSVYQSQRKTPDPLYHTDYHQHFVGPQYVNNKIEIRCGQYRKHSMGLLIGPSTRFCDIVVHDQSGSEDEAPVWGLITYDGENRLIYRDVRHPLVADQADRNQGSRVFFDNERSRPNADDKRRGHTWVLSGSKYLQRDARVTKLVLNDYIRFDLKIPNYDHGTATHEDHVRRFIQAPLVGDWERPGPPLCLDSCAHNPPRKPIILQKKIGYGAFGEVWSQYNVSTGTCVARKKPRDPSKREQTLREIHLLREIQNGSSRDEKARDYSQYIIGLIRFEMGAAPTIFLEYAHYGSLLSIQCSENRLQMAEAVEALEQLLKATCFLHSVKITHRDIKPANVLVTKRAAGLYRARGDIAIKLADFGLSKAGLLKTTCIGTYVYMAPELFAAEAMDNMVDIWATGVMFFDICYGLPPEIRNIQAPNNNVELMRYGPAMCNKIEEAIQQAMVADGADKMLAHFIRTKMVRQPASDRQSAEECLLDIRRVHDQYVHAGHQLMAPNTHWQGSEMQQSVGASAATAHYYAPLSSLYQQEQVSDVVAHLGHYETAAELDQPSIDLTSDSDEHQPPAAYGNSQPYAPFQMSTAPEDGRARM